MGVRQRLLPSSNLSGDTTPADAREGMAAGERKRQFGRRSSGCMASADASAGVGARRMATRLLGC